jgi:TonB family protein
MAYLGPSLRREKRTERPARRTAAAILASILVNAVAFWALAVAGAFRLPGAKVDPSRVALAPVSPERWEANRTVAGQPGAPAAPPQEEERPAGKVVELSPEQKAADAPPPNARFLSDRNARVDKETVSRFAGNYPRNAARPEPGADGPVPEPQPKPRRGGRSEGEPGDEGEGAKGRPGRPGSPGERVAAARPPEGLRLPAPGGGDGGGGRRGGGGGADLSLSSETLARIAGGPSMDGVGEGLPEGDATWLNSKEFKYATYINRMRQGIGQQWYPRVREAVRDRDPDGSVFLYRERTVALQLTIDTEGHVKDLSVLQSSSIDFFDRVAVASVQAAQPFPNPPAGMFRNEPEVRIPFFFTMYPHGASLFWRAPAHE